MLGQAFLDGVGEGDCLDERIDLAGECLMTWLYPNLRRIDAERRLRIIVPLESSGLRAVYYQEVIGDGGRRDVKMDWKRSPGKSPDDLPKSLKI
ncbi:MAG: hypothetical protein CFK52_07610 [Chloracidobacterium sp. CP2_5A]|nr:MAG: hypothetical protein CFK52_07610 [Chloracidobacterium sp. CP2_5A]